MLTLPHSAGGDTTMNAKKKKFDCVQMKWDIQQKLLKEMKGLSAAEQARFTENRIMSDPILARIWKKAKRNTGKRSRTTAKAR